jgi:predicted component of type VI protein secretion system
MEYYKLPIKFGDLMKRRELPRCRDIGESISQNIHLMITSRFGEYRFDPTYGSNIWDSDFENIFAEADWSDRVSEALRMIIELHEPRLKNVTVMASINQEEIPASKNNPQYRIKQRVVVEIEGVLTTTNERFSTTQKLYISPLSFD